MQFKLSFNIAKDLKDATAAFNEAEFRLKLSDLYLSLSDARMNLAEAQQEISALPGGNFFSQSSAQNC